MGKEKRIETVLESLVDIYKHNSPVNRDRKYNRFLDNISRKGKYFSVKTILKLYSAGIKFMENGRAGDVNLFNTLSSLDHLLISKSPELGEKCGEKLKYIYSKNWALLETL